MGRWRAAGRGLPPRGGRGARAAAARSVQPAAPWPLAGEKVEVKWDGRWYECLTLSVSEEGLGQATITARYGEGGDEEGDIELATRVRRVQPCWVRPGLAADVLREDSWHACEVLAVNAVPPASCRVRYGDGAEESGIDVALRVRHQRQPGSRCVRRGALAEALHGGSWSEVEVLTVSPDERTCTVKYVDGGEDEEDVDVASRLRAPPLPFYALSVGQAFRGRVCSIYPHGIFVDIGASKDGFVPAARISKEPVGCIRDRLDLDFEVEVWICGLGARDGRLDLTMVQGWLGEAFGGQPLPCGFDAFRRQLLDTARRV